MGFIGIRAKNKTGLLLAGHSPREIIPPIFDSLTRLAPEIIGVQKDGFWGLVDTAGKHLLTPTYDEILPYTYSFAIVKKKTKYGLINKDGKELLYPEFDCIKPSEDSIILLNRNGKYSYLDIRGVFELEVLEQEPMEEEAIYGDIGRHRKGLNGAALIQKDGLYGLVGKDGHLICPPKYNHISNFTKDQNGWALVTRNGFCGFIDTTGKEVIPPQYSSCVVSENKTVIVKIDKKYGLIDIATNRSTTIDFDGVESAYDGIAVVIKNKKQGALDCRDFHYIVPCDYDEIERAWVGEKCFIKPVKQGKKGLANAEGTVLVPPGYEDIDQRFDAELGGFRVKNHGKWGLVDAKGKTKIPCLFHAIAPFVKGEARVVILPKQHEVIHSISGDYVKLFPQCYPVEYTINLNGEIIARQQNRD